MEKVRQSSGITFDIVLEENVSKPEPKRMLLMKNRQNAKEPLTADEIEKKQRLAEERRQARIKARLKRMREREESTRKLVQGLDILQQQQSLRTGQLQNSDNVPVMSRQEIFKTANDVVKRFKDMQGQLLNMDLKIDGQKHQAGHFPETKLQKASKAPKKEKTALQKMTINFNPDAKVKQKPEGIAFEIPLEDSGCSKQCKKKPAIAMLQKKHTATNRDLVTLKLEEKQWKAAERRQKRQNEKVRRTRERREALMELQTKVNIFRQHQAALEGQAYPGMILSEHEAASLAHEIADGFSYIHGRYKADLERAEGFFMVYDKTL